ncbi:MAG TPA: thioredoxin domain-containing protein [Solirubrobacteraceae bacterium]|jgi:protein-disulfide isomerase|nr:thioredoxin domain-containing protein [Solirubrobacteraceae bacterium]
MSSVNDPESDLTRKQRREQAREERRAMEEASAAQASQRKRLIQLGGVAGVVIVIIAIIVIATGSGGSKTAPAPKSAAATAASTSVITLLQGIPESANTLGYPSAPVTLVYYGDLECPFCKQFTLTALPSVIQKDVRTGKAKIQYRSMQTATHEKETFQTQQTAALAAGKQNRMWYYVELFYHEQGEEGSGYVTESYLQGLASQVPGLNTTQWSSDRNNPAYANEVISDAQSANQNGFTGTPSFIVEKAGAAPKKLENPSLTDPKGIEEAIGKA